MMLKSKSSDEQIIATLAEQERGMATAEGCLCTKIGFPT